MDKMSRRSFVPMLGTLVLGASCMSIQDEKLLDGLAPTIIRPKRLKKGDTIGVCAPAGGYTDPQEMDDFEQVLNGYGFQVKRGKNVDGRYGYFSADDQERAAAFMELIEDDAVDGIFFLRGGWGCARILEYLDFERIKNHPKVIMGFSDITTLLNAISHKTGLVTFHGPGGNSSWNDFSWDSIQQLLMNAAAPTIAPVSMTSQEIKPRTIAAGEATGALYGGNLSVLSGLIGSEYLPDWRGKILFLEDVMEEPYRIDRMLTQLKLNGIFNQVAGIVLGQFRRCEAEEQDRSFTVDEVFEQHFSSANIPVFSGAAFGHIRYKHTIPVGMEVTINAAKQTLTINAPSVV